MRGHANDDDELIDFVAARTAELHRTAYLLTADQDRAERLVESVVGDLRRQGFDSGQGETTARHRMARMAGAVVIRTSPAEENTDPTQAIAMLSPRERAVLMLRCLDGYDPRSAAGELGLPRSKIAMAEESACQSIGFDVSDTRIRAALTDFAEQATWPDPDTTWSRSAGVRPPRRHSRRRYVAVATILALTVAAPVGSQLQHDRWLRTPAGINASHGTHFRAYTQGYKLVDVQRVPVGSTRTLRLPADDAVVLECPKVKSPADEARAPVVGDGQDTYPAWCNDSADDLYELMPATSVLSVHARPLGGRPVYVADYRPVSWNDYPVATGNFRVENDMTLLELAQGISQTPPVRTGQTLTMHGTNGVFNATVQRPSGASNTSLLLSMLLSPTTTGWYRVTVDGQSMTECGVVSQSDWCRIYDAYVPQISQSWTQDAGGAFTPEASSGPAEVTVEVRHALGPWKLQMRYDRFRPGN